MSANFKRVLAGLALALVTTTSAMAQLEDKPPRPKRADTPPALWNYFAAIVLIAAIAGASTIPSKRGHQD
ncbi:MAG: hypothetical protein ACKVW3_16550 [Phycisphaerales bacterium]